MEATLEFVIPTAEGVFLIRDVSAATSEAQRPASDATRIPGSRGGRMFGAAGAVLLVRCAHQYSRPWLRLELLDHEPADAEGPWHWEVRTTLDLPTGRIRVDPGDDMPPAELLDIDAGAGPGTYGITLGHTGRTQMQEQARRIAEATLHADEETTTTGCAPSTASNATSSDCGPSNSAAPPTWELPARVLPQGRTAGAGGFGRSETDYFTGVDPGRAHRRRRKVTDALNRLHAQGAEITVSAVARAAGVDRSFLYRHHDLRT